MAYKVTKTTRYGERVSNSFKSIGTGIALFLLATVLLWWNEGRAVKTTKMLGEAQDITVLVEDVSVVDPELDGKLIHATALTSTEDSLSDATFGVGAVAIKLNRDVEYYQWVEHSKTETKDKVGGGEEKVTTYTYKKEWVSKPIDSKTFTDPEYRMSNFAPMDIEDEEYIARNVKFGAYTLSDKLIRCISGEVPLDINISEEQITAWDKEIRETNRKVGHLDTTDHTVSYVHVNGNQLHFGKNENLPQVGDMRISFTKVLPDKVSVLALVTGDELGSFTAKNGKTFSRLSMGSVSAENMYQSEHSSNRTMLWIFRLVGLLLIFLSFKMIFNLLVTLLKVLPFLANIANLGINLVCGIVAFAWSLVIISLSWIWFRPVLGVFLLVIVIGLIAFLSIRSKKAVAPAA